MERGQERWRTATSGNSSNDRSVRGLKLARIQPLCALAELQPLILWYGPASRLSATADQLLM